MASPVDVDGLPNHVKYCVSAYPQMNKYQYITGMDSLTISIRAYGLKWYLIFPQK